MKLLHTSDWHLGRMLYRQKRYEEFSLFLDWLLATIDEHQIDTLLISGDIFDTTTPSNLAQKLYYEFLSRLGGTCCHNTVIIGGNHDSPTFLNAPKALLQAFNVHVVGSKAETIEDEVLLLSHKGMPEAIVCAVPYLRDRDIRSVEAGESLEDKGTKLADGMRSHYEEVCSLAVRKQEALSKDGHPSIPIIGMGHLFAAGGETVDGDGVRELYIGSLSHVGSDMFPPSIDYLALGHLHVPQMVGGLSHMRYSGSPIPMGFGEAKQEKQVVLVQFDGGDPIIKALPVPCFQPLVRITGSLDHIASVIEKLARDGSSAWLEIEYTGTDSSANLREEIEALLEGSSLVVTIIKNKRTTDRVLNAIHEHETLEDLDTSEVFKRCLDAEEIPEEERVELTASYNEIVQTLAESDTRAE
ncbi:MAG: exonuclease SbcCD subunit D C-terminal domain-containing protein [Sphaerochaeta sp.]|nr:exonuclease SbcCD subunit D C-terminal domain-containing protein [Sphaerochaeta sp.]